MAKCQLGDYHHGESFHFHHGVLFDDHVYLDCRENHSEAGCGCAMIPIPLTSGKRSPISVPCSWRVAR